MGAEERGEPEEMSFAKHSIRIEGKRYRLVRYGEEIDDEGRDFFSTPCHICGTPPGALHARGCPMGGGRPNSRPPLCRDCGTAVGHIHKLGCGVEQCPRCRRQYMSCSCESNEDDPDPGELKSAYCWERADRIPDDPNMTVFRRRARLSQAIWRDAQGLPIGHQPITGDPGSRKLGSRIELGYARETGANLITEAARKAARDRVAAPEPHQTLNADRLWADLLSSKPMCFNLFGDLAADPEAADAAVHAWWPDSPGRVVQVRFEWSPGRLDPNYLGNRSAFDVAFLLDLGDGRRGVVGVETKYHEVATTEAAPKPHRLRRYEAVARSSEVFRGDPSSAVVGTDLQQLWLDHLLALSMLQHPEEPWAWARFVLVHPERNTSFEGVANRYRKLLRDESSFQATTLEEMVVMPNVLPSTAAKAFRSRYLGP